MLVLFCFLHHSEIVTEEWQWAATAAHVTRPPDVRPCIWVMWELVLRTTCRPVVVVMCDAGCAFTVCSCDLDPGCWLSCTPIHRPHLGRPVVGSLACAVMGYDMVILKHALLQHLGLHGPPCRYTRQLVITPHHHPPNIAPPARCCSVTILSRAGSDRMAFAASSVMVASICALV